MEPLSSPTLKWLTLELLLRGFRLGFVFWEPKVPGALCQLRYSLHHQQQKQALLLSLHLWTQDGSLMCSGCCVVSRDAIAALSRPNLKFTESRGSALAMVTAGSEVLLEITITGYLLHFNYPQPITLRCLANRRKRQKLWDIRGLRKQLS